MEHDMGKHYFEKKTQHAVSQFMNRYSHFQDTKTVNFHGSSGLEPRVLTYIKDVNKFIDEVCSTRGIKKPDITLSIDSGQGKLILCMGVFDEEVDVYQPGEMPGASDQVLVLGMVDKVSETHQNIEIFFG